MTEAKNKLRWSVDDTGLIRRAASADGAWRVVARVAVMDAIQGFPRVRVTASRSGEEVHTLHIDGDFLDAQREAQLFIDSVEVMRAAPEVREATTESSLVTEQSAPVANDQPAVWPLVVADMTARDAEGRRKYGVPLQPHNGRDVLIDAYQEALDLCVYLRQAIYERDGK